MENLFIDHAWFCQDAALWYEQHVQDLDINRLHNEMIGYTREVHEGRCNPRGNLYQVHTNLRFYSQLRHLLTQVAIADVHRSDARSMLQSPGWMPSGGVITTSRGVHGSYRRILVGQHGRADHEIKHHASTSSRTSRLGVRAGGDQPTHARM